ncbi:MAG: 2-hydroxyacyl-CoA dehydratase [Selenomonadaceae bacterium]|nr:2-hydroxyacyl-CoA dehydratase [Selenomonadaceae bacterium]
MKVGIDIGSTTIKLVVMDEERLLFKNYARHFSEISSALTNSLTSLKNIIGEKTFKIAVAGSAGMGIAKKISLPFVQEVIACQTAVEKFIPQTNTVVELGGEDAKIIYLGNAPEVRMNGVCAGGTGSFIDHMASLLSTDALGLNALAEKGKQIYTIASRCGVFAKTDIQALMNDGATKADIALSIFQAVVNQTIGNLAQGRPIGGNVAFLGGPLHFLPELKKRFVETLGLSKDEVVETPDGNFFVATGAALSDEAQEFSVEQLESSIKKSEEAARSETRKADFILFRDETDYKNFRARHEKNRVKRGDLSTYHGKIFVGIDAGSTTTKICAIGEGKEILYTNYGSNEGAPLKIVVSQIRDLYEKIPPTAKIGGVFTTGYGEAIVKAALHADGSEVETFAHLTAAQEFCPDVSFVLDIGGQDMKCFFVKDGTIGNITLNEACSAGCGSFIQNFAQGLNMSVGDFAKKALTSEAPVDLGTRCTVFMNSKVKQAQKEGATVSDISAGIALSVIKNALFKVMQLKNVEDLGENIVVQGGTFYNDAVLRSVEEILHREVIRPDIAGLMGAYGVAILARENFSGESKLLSADELENFSVVTKSYRCGRCGNNCLITMQKFPDGGKYFTGNRCERGVGGQRDVASSGRAPTAQDFKGYDRAHVQSMLLAATKNPKLMSNAFAYKYHRLFDYQSLENPPRGSIGIPRVLNLYEDFPFWHTFFTALGYRVEISSKSSAQIFYKGISTIPSDSLCYPAKLAHGHIMDLVERGLKKIFYPCAPYNFDTRSDNFYNCPIVAGYPENIRNNMDVLKERGVKFLQPFLPVHDMKKLKKRIAEEFADENISAKEISAAVDAAAAEMENYRRDVKNFGDELLARLKRTGEHAILLVGRPYHIDPEINHGIAEMIQSYGLPILSEDCVYHVPVDAPHVSVVNQWSYHARLYHAAQFAAQNPNVTLIQLSSFGCGLDALTIEQVKEILEAHGKIYTMIKLDEVSNLGSARIRLRSLLAALKRKTPVAYSPKKFPPRPRFTPECKSTHTILAPQMAPVHFELVQAVLQKYGYKVLIPPMPDRKAIDLGLRFVNNEMCYPAIVVTGQILAALESGECDPDNTSVILFQTCGGCRATNYISVMRRALKFAGFGQVPVFACWGLPEETDAFELSSDCLMDAIKASVYGDLLVNVSNRMRPYELERGQTDKLFAEWMTRAKADLVDGNFLSYRRNVKEIVRQFDAIPIDESLVKPRVGIVGEILVKYHPVANNYIERLLAEEGAEVIAPDFVDFFLYCAYDAIVKRELLGGTRKEKFFAEIFIQFIEFFRRPMKNALKDSKHFRAPHEIKDTARLASRFLSNGNFSGEGWLICGEMVSLIENDVKNIVGLSPWACLPNHVILKGVLHALRANYDDVNIVAIDCDAGSSEVNQLNRIKLMTTLAKKILAKKKFR